MKSAKLRGALLVLVPLFLLTVHVQASGPCGMYAVVQKVTFEPDETAPDRVQIHGAFAFVAGGIQSPEATSDPQRGSLYFRIPDTATEAQKQTIRKEWADLKAIANTGQGVAFGDWYYLRVFTNDMSHGIILVNASARAQESEDAYRVRILKDSDPRGVPTIYTTGAGIVKLAASGSHAAIIARLKGLVK